MRIHIRVYVEGRTDISDDCCVPGLRTYWNKLQSFIPTIGSRYVPDESDPRDDAEALAKVALLLVNGTHDQSEGLQVGSQ